MHCNIAKKILVEIFYCYPVAHCHVIIDIYYFKYVETYFVQVVTKRY